MKLIVQTHFEPTENGKRMLEEYVRKKLGIKSTRIKGASKSQILAHLHNEQNGRCYYCLNPFPLQMGNLEHKQPRSKGGKDDIGNLAFTCYPCNSRKGNMTEKEFMANMAENDWLRVWQPQNPRPSMNPVVAVQAAVIAPDNAGATVFCA